MSDKVEIVENIEDLEVSTYSKVEPNDPTISVEKTEYLLGEDENNLTDSQAKTLSDSNKLTSPDLADVVSLSKEELSSALFSFEEVDKQYNEGISKKEKQAFVVWWQTISGKKLLGGFGKNYGMPQIEVKEVKGWKEYIGGTLQFEGYKLGDRLAGEIVGKETILDDEHYVLATEFNENLDKVKKEYARLKKSGDIGINVKMSEAKYIEEEMGEEALYQSNKYFRFTNNIKKAENFDLIGLFDTIKGLSAKTQVPFFAQLKNSWDSLAEPKTGSGDSKEDTFATIKAIVGENEETITLYNEIQETLYGMLSRKEQMERDSSYGEQIKASRYSKVSSDIKNVSKQLDLFLEALENAMWNIFPYSVPKEIRALLDSGHLYYDGSEEIHKRFQPKTIFTSGNIYQKDRIFRGDRYGKYAIKNIIETELGEKCVKEHEKTLAEAFELVKSNIIKINDKDNEGRTIDLKPNSDLASNDIVFSIKKFLSPRQKTGAKDIVYIERPSVYIKKSASNYGDGIDTIIVENSTNDKTEFVKKQSGREGSNNYKEIEDMSLQFAFQIWLLDLGEGGIEYGIQVNDGLSPAKAIAIYFTNLQVLERVPETNEIEKVSSTRLIELKESATENIERLFKLFLQKGLMEEDKDRLELAWNMSYNAMLQPKLDNIPIGFSYKKYFKFELNTIRPEKLNAIRFWLSRGTCGLAYGVGVGKTWCANFIVAQALDMGLSNQPLFVLPNQVYKQYINEILQIIKPSKTLKIRKLKNLSKEFHLRTKKIKRDIKKKGVTQNILVITYEGLNNLYLDKQKLETEENSDTSVNLDWIRQQILILISGNPNTSDDKIEDELAGVLKKQSLINQDVSTEEQSKEITKAKSISEGSQPVYYNGVDIDPDFLVCDEVHNFKNLFSKVEGKPLDTNVILGASDPTKIQRQRNNYSELTEATPSKQQSSRAKKKKQIREHYFLVSYTFYKLSTRGIYNANFNNV
jgi:hypothetical protein